MAEVLGVIASVITLSNAVAQGTNQSIELYRAPVEVETLQVGTQPWTFET